MSAQSSLSIANKKFTLDLFKTIFGNKSGENVFISPFSVSVALAMTQLGAREATATSMAKALCWPDGTDEQIHEQFQTYLALIQMSSDSYSLSTANRIYLQHNMIVLDDFKKKTKNFYFAEPINSDFAGSAETERIKINLWVAEQTKDKIKDLIAQGVLDALTKMVLVNAIYFKGKWNIQFEEFKTRPSVFKIGPGQTKEVPMMNANEKYSMTESEELKCRAIEIPYKGKDLSMVIILPVEDFGLKDVVEGLTPSKLSCLLSCFGQAYTEVDLSLPKFEVTNSLSLNEALSSLGMSDAFTEDADFSGMTGNKDLNISAVIHKAFVKVNEEGTEAAAASAFVMQKCAIVCVCPRFIVDHPFLFVIRDTRHYGVVLFIGTIVDPSST